MNTYLTIATGVWGVWWVVWFVTSFTAKKKVSQKRDASQILSIIFLVAAFSMMFNGNRGAQTSTVAGVTGLIVMGVSILFCIRARFELGRNWSGTIAVKQDHELVIRGPYRIVRHPIYTGLLGGFIGMAIIVGGWLAWLSVIAGLIAFLIRIPQEEKLMIELFGDRYLQYKNRTKTLIPFVI